MLAEGCCHVNLTLFSKCMVNPNKLYKLTVIKLIIIKIYIQLVLPCVCIVSTKT